MKKIIFSIILSTLCAFHINAQQISVNAVAPFPGNIVDIGPAGHGFTITIHNNTGADLSEKYRFNFSQTGLYYNNIVSNSAKVVVESVAADHSAARRKARRRDRTGRGPGGEITHRRWAGD